MKFQTVLKTTSAVGAAAVAFPLLVLAQGGSGINQPVSPVAVNFTFQTVIAILNTVVTWVFTVFLIVAVIFILLAAFNYLFSQGDPTKVKTATKQVVYEAVAIAVALLSVSIRFVVEQLIGAPQL